MWSLLDGTLAHCHATDEDEPLVEDLKELVLSYCGSARAAGCGARTTDTFWPCRSSATACPRYPQVRDELLPLRDRHDDSE